MGRAIHYWVEHRIENFITDEEWKRIEASQLAPAIILEIKTEWDPLSLGNHPSLDRTASIVHG